MKAKAEEDLQYIKDLIDKKYRAGNREHNGDILNMTSVEYFENSIDEKIDDLVYTIKGLDEIKEKDKNHRVPKRKINGLRYGQLIWNVIAKSMFEEPTQSMTQNERVAQSLFYIENEDLNNLIKEYLEEK